MASRKVETGLSGLLNPTPAIPRKAATAVPTQEQPQAPEKSKGNYKTVCYSIPPAVAENIKRVAWYERKKINAVVTDAFEKYVEQWNAEHPDAANK
jgi:hypothetical protein